MLNAVVFLVLSVLHQYTPFVFLPVLVVKEYLPACEIFITVHLCLLLPLSAMFALQGAAVVHCELNRPRTELHHASQLEGTPCRRGAHNGSHSPKQQRIQPTDSRQMIFLTLRALFFGRRPI